MQTTYTEENVRTFVEEVTSALDGKENYLVEQGSADNSVKLLTATVGNAIGVVRQKLQAGHPDVSIRMLGKDGTVKVVANGVIAQGDRVIGASGGKVTKLPTAAGRYRVLGRKLTYGNSANNDVIEISDQPETIVVPTVVTLGNTNSEIGGLTISAAYSQAEVTALRDKCEELADDLRAIHAALVAQGDLLAS